MKRYYQKRVILGAMLAFLILMVLSVAGIWLFTYRQMERDTDDFLRDMLSLEENSPPAFSQSAPPMFGYTPDERRYPSGFYDITMSEDGSIQSIQQRGIIEDAGINVQQFVQQAAAEKSSGGKIGSYKYSISFREDGSARMILLDISIQLQALYNTFKSALLVSTILLAALLLIMIPVSARVATIFVRNTEKQKQFITDAGHDLKTPIAIMRSNLDVMELLQGKNQWSGNIRSQVDRLEHLVSQLVMMARLEESKALGAAEKIDFSRLLREQMQTYEALLAQKKAAVAASVPEGLAIMGHREAILQMVGLLMDNAVQYINEQGLLTVHASADRKRIRFTIANTADQLPDREPEELTERFIRGDTARSQKTGGAGVGLSAVKRIVDMHRGKMTIQYRGGNEFCVMIDLPEA